MKIVHEIINRGKGSYGSGQSQITKDQLLRIYDETGALSTLKLTTSGTSGPATYNSATNTLNIPNYSQQASTGYVPYTGAIANVNLGNKQLATEAVQFNLVPTALSTVGKVKWNPDFGTLEIGMGYTNVFQRVGIDNFYPPIKNQTGSLISRGTVVMSVGTLGNSGRILVAPAIANGTVASRFMLGVTMTDMANGDDGLAMWFGEIKGFNTVAMAPAGETWVNGDVLWINPAIPGGMTKVEPSAPNIKVSIALVVHAATNGIIVVRPSLGLRLTDLHDVNAFSPAVGNLIAFEGTRWVNRTVGQALGFTALGDTIYGGASGVATVLPGNTTTTRQFLSQTGTGSASAAPSWATIAGTDVTGAALTKTDDTNVTLTLGGTPSAALLRAASLTLGWTGQLSVARGGTGASTLTGVVVGNGASAMTAVAGTANQILRRNAGNTAYEFFTIAGSDITGAALTKTDDTNVTITLGGTPATSLLRATSLTLGWTGQLAISRGGTGLSTLGTANQLLRVNSGATALEYFTPAFLTAAITSLNGLTASTQTFANDTNVTITSATSTHTIGWSGQLSVARGGTGASTLTGVVIGNGASAMTAVAGTASQILRRNAANTAYEFFTISGSDITGAALTETDDTNVTMTLGGTPSTALLRAVSMTLGWTGQLAVSRGGTGLSALGTASQLLRVNAGATALEYFTHDFINQAGARSAISLTTAGAFGIATYNSSTGVLSIPSHPTYGATTVTFTSAQVFASLTNDAWGHISGYTVKNLSAGDIGAAAASHTHAASAITAGTFGTGNYVFPGNVQIDGQINSTVNAKGNSGTGTVTFNWNDANIQSVTLTGSCTFAFSNPLSGASYQIIITQDATGGRAITWPTIHWVGRAVPTLTGTANSKDIVTLTYDGTNYNGVISKNHEV